MSRVLLVLSALSLLILMAGTALVPQNPVFWLATNSGLYQVIRGVLAVILLAQSVTEPPRHWLLRGLAGVVSIGIVAWVVVVAYLGSMLFLDVISLLAAACAIGVTAMESAALPHSPAPPSLLSITLNITKYNLI